MNDTEQIKQQFMAFMQKMNAWEVAADTPSWRVFADILCGVKVYE